MTSQAAETVKYEGFEQGPIRPPSEAHSLLLRLTRNCPWNRCKFCPVYKGSKFSLRPVDHIIKDIDTVHKFVKLLNERRGSEALTRDHIIEAGKNVDSMEIQAFHAALNWISGGMKSIFLQDANSLIMKPDDLARILSHIKECFPQAERITSYARSHTIARISDENLKNFADSGLNRIHIGLESGSDTVLKMINKGATKAVHIKAGQKVKKAGIELSEYVMPGLGGVALSQEHAIETADALNQINPDFIRLRSLAIPNHVELYEDYVSGAFEKCPDFVVARELLLFLETLDGITSYIKSDHILNLFEDLEGRYPDDKPAMINVLRRFLALPAEERVLYQVGRRIGVFRGLDDMKNRARLDHAAQAAQQIGVTAENVDAVIDELMKRFI